MILIVGANGSMGRRYQAILRYLGREFVAADKELTNDQIKSVAKKTGGIILATPTDTHAQFIRELAHLQKPILCEKPVVKNVDELKDLIMDLRRNDTPFRMMYQYKMLVDPARIGPTRYNYFKHGNDGLIWDCMQIIGLARGDVRLDEDSPIWRCMINGKALSLQHMDAAYIGYVQTWFQRPKQDLGEILAVHERTAEAERKHNGESDQRSYRNPS